MPSSSQRLTVLHYVGYDTDSGGIISAVRALAAADLFDCVLGVNPAFQYFRRPALPIATFPAVSGEQLGLKTFWRTRNVARDVRQWLRDDQSRRFHGHSRAGLAVALWLKKAEPRRTFASVHSFGRQRWFYRWAARSLGQRLFWLSPTMRTYFGLPGIAWEQCIPSAITEIKSGQRRTRVPGEPIIFGGIGVLVPLKGWDLVLDALNRLPMELQKKARFHHIGSGNGMKVSLRYEAMLRAHPLGQNEDRVRWLGECASSLNFLRNIDCLIVPSINEALSLAMLEALNTGVPVLRSDSGGGTEVIAPGRNGWLFRSGDVADLARHLERLLTTDVLDRTEAAPELIAQFSSAKIARQWLAVYGGL